MRILSEFIERVRALLFRSREESEMEEELRFHIEMETEKNICEGLAPERARRQAMITFGGVEYQKEAVRDARGTRWLEDVWADLRYAARTFGKHPAFTAVIVAILAVGIGTATAMFSVVDGVLLRPLPVRDQDRVVVMWAQRLSDGWQHVPLSFRNFQTFEERARVFDALAAVDYNGAITRPVEYGDRATKMNVAFVSADLFRLLGASPELGRTLDPNDGLVGASPVVVISHGVWRREFGADPGVLGSRLTVYGLKAAVVGIMPRGFDFPTSTEVWAPILPFTDAGRHRLLRRVHPRGGTARGRCDRSTRGQRSEHVRAGRERALSR